MREGLDEEPRIALWTHSGKALPIIRYSGYRIFEGANHGMASAALARSPRANPARRRPLYSDARPQFREPVIESPDGRIRRCAGAARAVATQLEVVDAGTVWTRTATERWAVMIGFSTGKLVGWRRREWPASATRWERSHQVSKDTLPSCGSALIAEVASHPVVFMSLKIGRNIATVIVCGCPTSRVSRAVRSCPKNHVFVLTI